MLNVGNVYFQHSLDPFSSDYSICRGKHMTQLLNRRKNPLKFRLGNLVTLMGWVDKEGKGI